MIIFALSHYSISSRYLAGNAKLFKALLGKAMGRSKGRAEPRLLREALERRLPILVSRPSLLLPLKIVAHLLTFQHFSTGLYLLLQGLVRGDGGLRGALAFLRARYVAAVLPSLGSFLIGGPIIYSLPVAIGAALRNVGVLAICIYLAFISAR